MLLLAAWVGSRGWLLWLLAGPHAWVLGDVGYFQDSLAESGRVGLGTTLVEYPLPGVAVIALPWLAVHLAGAPGAYTAVVVGVSVLADAAFTWLLAHSGPGRPRRWLGAWSWVAAVPALGVTSYARFDLVPALLCAIALLAVARRPVLGGALGAVATGLKLWPVVALAPLVAASRWPRRTLAAVVTAGGVLVAGSVLAAGWDRLFTPLTWQAERGLQVEAVAATPALLAWLRAPDRWAVGYGEHNAYEVFGPGVGELLAGTRVATAVAGLVLGVLWWRALRGARPTGPVATGWLVLAGVAALVVTGPVLSPQYLLWLLAPAAVLAGSGAARAAAWTGCLLVATLLTQVVFPWQYAALTVPADSPGAPDGTALVVGVLVLRNALLVVLAVWAFAEAAAATGGEVSRAARWPATHRSRRAGRAAAGDAAQPTPTGDEATRRQRHRQHHRQQRPAARP